MRSVLPSLALIAALVLPQTGWALSCAQLSAGQHVRSLINAGTVATVIRGDLRYAPGQDLGEELVDGALDLKLEAVISGRLVTPEGPGDYVDLTVTERHFCHDPWCTGPRDAAGIDDAIFVLRTSRHGLFFESGMCAFEFYAASPEVEAELLACMNASPDCPPPQY